MNTNQQMFLIISLLTLFRISESKLISNIFSILLAFLIQLKKLLRNTTGFLVSLLLKKIVSSTDKKTAFSFTCVTPDDISKVIKRLTVRESSPYSELFWSIFSRIWTEYRQILHIPPYFAQMRENTDQNNSEYGHFLRSVNIKKSAQKTEFLQKT